MSDETLAAMTLKLEPADKLPPLRTACLLVFDIGDNCGAGLDEVYSIGWHDGKRWFDVHGAHGASWKIEPWLQGWFALESSDRLVSAAP